MPSLPNHAIATTDGDPQDALQSYFKPHVSPDDIDDVFRLKRAQPLLQAFTALFHGGFNGVLVRLLVLRELAAESAALTRSDINARLSYLEPESLETILARLRSHQLLNWDPAQGVYRVTPQARNILAALEGLLGLGQEDDDAEMAFLLSQVAGAHAIRGVTADHLHQLLGRLIDLTEEFRDAIASGSEFRLRAAQTKWNQACDWVEKGSQVIHAITTDINADTATHRAAQAIGRAQSALLNMQGMFSRALNQIERQRVHLGQSGLSTTDIKTWLMKHPDLNSLAADAIAYPVTPLFITPSEMIDVAEAELLAQRPSGEDNMLPAGENAIIASNEAGAIPVELDAWLSRLAGISLPENTRLPVQDALLPASFAVASYRASLLPLIGDESEAALQGGTATMARMPLAFAPHDEMIALDDPQVAAVSHATLSNKSEPETKHE